MVNPLEVNRLFEVCGGKKKQRGGGNYMAGQNNNANNTEQSDCSMQKRFYE